MRRGPGFAKRRSSTRRFSIPRYSFAIRMANEYLGIVNRRVEDRLFANPGPRRIGFHHAFHHAQVAAGLDVPVFEEAIGDDHGSLFGVDGHGHRRSMMDSRPEDANAR